MTGRRPLLRRLLVALTGALGALLLRTLGATWRVRIEGDDPVAAGRLVVAATWHRGLLMMAHHYRDLGAVVMVSLSRDGDLIAAALRRLGYAPPPRGSTSRGGARALRRQIELVRAGHYSGVLCDGPRGPARHLQSGVLVLSRQVRLPIQAVAFSARPAIRFGSWDRVILPLPFARVRCAYGRAFEPPARGEESRVGSELNTEIDRLTDALDTSLGLEPEQRLPAPDATGGR